MPEAVTFLRNKKYFVIIDKDEQHPRKPYFDIVLLELVKDDPYYHQLIYLDIPFFTGTIHFDKEPDKINLIPFKFWKRTFDSPSSHSPKKSSTAIPQDSDLQNVDPDLVRLFILNAQFAVIGNHLNRPQGYGLNNSQTVEQDSSEVQKEQMDDYIRDLLPIYDYIQSLRYDKIRNYIFCRTCKMNKKITLIDETTRYKSQAFFICRDCAGQEVLQTLKKRVEVSPQLKAYLRDLLVKYKDVNKVLNVFSPNFNILEHPEATLVAITKASISQKEIIPMNIYDLSMPTPLVRYFQQQDRIQLLPAQILAIEAGLLEKQDELIVSATSSGKTMIGELAGITKILNEKMSILEKQQILNPIPVKITGETLKKLSHNAETESSSLEESPTNPQVEPIVPKPMDLTNDQKKYLGQLREIPSHNKMLYIVPIVALANMRFREYQELKHWGVTAALRIGISHLSKKRRSLEEFGDFRRADIIVATYEAVDILLRSGHPYLLKHIATVIVDEIQMLADPERGFVLDGLIARLRSYIPHSQFLYLSATISDPVGLAKHLRAALVNYTDRPVPMEKHLVMCLDENWKAKNLVTLVRSEFKEKSSFGYHGQSIIFTNSRKNTERLAEHLSQNGIRAYSYHAGLTYDQRKFVEKSFDMQKVQAVVTTAALAAGVDFPASQVIFANLTMGIKWLTVADFEQMSGRAGRLKKHDLGKVFVLITPGKSYVGSATDTEDRVAIRLLHGKIEPLQLSPDEDASFTELLATISMYSPIETDDRGMPIDTLVYSHSLLFNGNFALKIAITQLTEQQYIRKVYNNQQIRVTTFGRAVAESFLRINQTNDIRNQLMNPVNEESPAPDMIDIARSLHPFNNVYVTNRILSEISTKNQSRSTSNNLFSNAVLRLIDAQNLGKKQYLSRRLFGVIRAWSEEIFNCNCKNSPDCDCGRRNVERILIDYRLAGLTINQIIETMADEFEIQTFQGDLTDFFESLIYSLLAIQKMGRALKVTPQTMLKIHEIPHIVSQLIQPSFARAETPKEEPEDSEELINQDEESNSKEVESEDDLDINSDSDDSIL